MAHEISIRENGKAEMAFAAGSEPPWHFEETAPTEVPANASIGDWIIAAGMDWTVQPAPVRYEADGQAFEVEDRYVLHRSDTYAPLGIVSGDYCVLQPAEVLEFFDDLVQTAGLKLDTAGTLFGGKRFWALAKIGEDCMVDDRDRIKGYLLLTTSADGTRATEARHTSIRVVCNNTLTLSDRKDSIGQIKISHRSLWNADDVKRRLGVAPQTFERFMDRMRRLADHRLTDREASDEVRILLGKQEVPVNKEGKTFERIMDLFRGLSTGHDLPGVDGTAFGLLNAITEASDHLSSAKSESHRFANAMMGSGEQLKIRARDQLLALVS